MPAAKYKAWEAPDKLEQIRQWVKSGLTDAKIAERMGVTKQMLSKWRRMHPKIRQALVRLKTVDGKTVDAHDLNTGRPRKLDNVTVVQLKVDEWMERCREDNIPLTKSGLCLALNISKSQLNVYANTTDSQGTVFQRSELDGKLHPVTVADVLKRANLAIENDLETRMLTGKANVAGCIFDLKNNHGYADKSEVTSIKPAQKAETDEQIDKRIKELMDKAGHVVPFSKTG